MKYFFCIISIVLMWDLSAQKEAHKSDEIYELLDVEEPAAYPGAEMELMLFLHKNLTFNTLKTDISYLPPSRFIFSFVIEKDGAVSDSRVLKPQLHDDFEKEVQKVFQQMPCWKPATINGEAVRQRYYLPITICWAG